MKFSRAFKLVFSVSLCCSGSQALAQVVERGVGVADRGRPDYDPSGTRVGTFLMYPSLSVAADWTDNYRATDTNRQADEYLIVSPEVRIASDWNRNSVNARFHVDQSLHARLNGENSTQALADVSSQYDISRRTAISADISAAHFVESRSSLGSVINARDPVGYENYHSSIGIAQDFNRLDLDLSAGANYLNFHNVRAFDGTLIDQNYRDYRSLEQSLTAKYDVGGGLGVIVTAQTNQDHYIFGPGSTNFNRAVNLDRNSNGYTLLGGLTFELSSLIFGSVQFGWLNHNYRDSRLKDVAGFSYNANILWNVTPLTSVRLRAARTVEDTSSTSVAGNTRDDFSIGVDHELYRYVIVSADARYSPFRPNGPGGGGREYGAGASVRYLVDRHWQATLSARYDGRSSSSTYLRYHAALVGLSVRYAL